MTLVDDSEVAVTREASPPEAPPRTRKWIRYGAAGIAIAVVAAVGWREYSIATHPAPSIGMFPMGLIEGEGAVRSDLPGESSSFVPLREDGVYTFMFSIANRGERPITVQSFPPVLPYFFETEVRMSRTIARPGRSWGDNFPNQPFDPFELKPREQRAIAIELRLRDGCTVSEAAEPIVTLERGRVSLRLNTVSTGFSHIPVDYTVEGRARSTEMPGTSIVFVTDASGSHGHPADCPPGGAT